MSVKTILKSDFLNKFRRLKSGIAGVTILFVLIGISVYATAAVPLDSFRQWNNPNYWIKYPKSAMPAWTNLFSSKLHRQILLQRGRDKTRSNDIFCKEQSKCIERNIHAEADLLIF